MCNRNYKVAAMLIMAGLVLALPFYACSIPLDELVTTEVRSIEEPEEEEPEPEPLPPDVKELIDEADGLYGQGLYGESNKAYRNAVLEVEKLDIEDREDLLDYLDERYQKTRQIVDTARMHHGNAMILWYEKRFEEALRELEMALEVYPKYQPAIDALQTLETLENLQ